MKKVLPFICTALMALSATSQEQIVKRPNQMVSKEYNYTTFEASAKKVVTDEMEKSTEGRYKNHPEYGVLPYNTQCEDCYEVIEERTALTRHFVKNGTNGKVFYNQAGMNAINYQDARGNWRAIDPRMFPTDMPNVYAAANQLSPTRIDLNKKEVSVFNGNTSIAFNRNLKLYHQTDDGKKLLATADWSKATVGTDGVYAKNIFPGVDLEVYAINGALKTNFILTSKPNLQNGFLVIEDDMQLPVGGAFATRYAKKTDLGYQGLLEVDADNSTLYHIGEAVAFDASNHRVNRQEKLSYEINGNKLGIVVPGEWLNKQGLVYPVTIDPLVSSSNTLPQASIAGSGGDGSGTPNPAFACQYNLTVASPANTTLTDIKWSFTYIAQNGATKNEGAIDFLYLGFRSPSNASLYWTCSNPPFLPGQCIGTNISSWSDWSSHVPAPSCAPYNLTFTMRFYDLFGTATCDNTYIGANSNWVMTVEGHSVEFANPGTPFTITGPVCAGQNLTANFNGGLYGVTPYNVNWSFNSSGTPSVGTGNNPSINFPTAGTTTVYCILTDACGLQQSATKTVTVNPAPSITITPSANPLCQGQSTTLNAAGATTFTWSANAGGGGGSSATVTPPLGQTVYSVTGTASGCTGTATTTITVNALPSVTATATPTAICSSQSATLTAGGASTYTWSANAGGGSSNPTTVTPSVGTTTYTVTGTDANNCVNTAQVTVTVTPTPTLTAGANPTTICAGQVVTLTVTGATTYTWDANAGNSNATTVTVTPANSTTYTVNGDNSGCPGSTTVAVTVNPMPVLTVTANPTSVCTGQSATLTASGATSYTWSGNAGGGNTNPAVITPTVTDTYTVTGDLGGCQTSTVITVNVGGKPTITVSSTDTTICNAQTVTLTASGALSYTWSPGGTGTSIVQSPTVTTTYSVSGDNNGCVGDTTFVITVNPTPTVTAVASPTAICSNASSTLAASGASTFTWSANAGSAQTSTVNVTPANTTTYTVNGTDNNGCIGTTQVTVSVTPTPTIIALANPPTVCAGQQVGLVANGTATSYSWSTGATTQITTATPTVNPTTYTVTGFNGTCSSFTTVSVGVTPQPTVSATATTFTICNGTGDTLNATYAPGNATLSWSPGSANTASVVVSPNNTTTYTVVATVGTCTAQATTTITVNQTPTLAVSAGATQTVCAGSQVTGITFTPAGTTVNWTNNNANIGIAGSGTGNIAGYAAPAVATQQIGTIIATPSANGCTGNSQSFTITINPTPTITGTASITDASCGLPNGDITGLVGAGGTAPLQYQWAMSGLNIPAPTGTQANLINVPGGSYNLTVTDAHSCTVTAGPYVINTTPAVAVSITATPTVGTAPLPVSFTGNTVGATTWTWNFGNGTGASTQNTTTTYTAGGDYYVILTGSNAGGCTASDTVKIHVDQAITLIVPNVFSPNGDNINDEFGFISSGITSLNCDIYNRWGQKVKTLSGPTAKWDGKLDNGNSATEGTYFYTVVASSYDGKPHNSQGTITIVH